MCYFLCESYEFLFLKLVVLSCVAVLCYDDDDDDDDDDDGKLLLIS